MQLLLTNMEYVGGFQFDNIQFVGKISVCRAGKASTGIFAAGDDKCAWTDQKYLDVVGR